MIYIKKERLLGREITFSRTPLQSIRAFFGAVEPERPSIPFFSERYRTYKKRIVLAGKQIEWGSVTPGTMKEQAGIKRLKERFAGGNGW
jgi:hypothetical protein